MATPLHVAAAQQKHKHLLNAGTNETADQMWARAGEFTSRVCYDVRADYALIRKPGGRQCGGVDCDKIADRKTFKIYDIVVGAGAPGAAPIFDDTNHTASPFDLVDPPRYEDAPPVTPTPKPPATGLKPRDQFGREFAEVNGFYAAEEGLQRVGGMVAGVDASVFEVLRGVADGQITDPLAIQNASRAVLRVVCDEGAMRQWGYDLMAGKTVDQCKAEIRQSDEWRAKHPGETP